MDSEILRAANGLRNAIHSAPCNHRGPTKRTEKKDCCGGVEIFDCAKLGREVWNSKCRTCAQNSSTNSVISAPSVAPAEKARLLNHRLRLPREFRPHEAQVECLEWPDGTTIAYDANSMAAVAAYEDMAEKLRRGDGNDLAGILGCRMVPAFQAYPAMPLKQLVLNVTHACNLRCKYCFAREYENLPVMSMETAEKALAMFAPDADLRVSFFGGEPMIGWKTVILTAERAHQLAYERKKSYRLHMTTNGTLIDAIKAAALARFNFSVLLSLDGPEGIHNANRPTAAGAGSFSATMAGLAALNGAGIVPMCRATFSEKPELVRRLDFFDGLYQAGKISGVSIEPAVLSEGCGHNADGSDLSDIETDWHEAARWYAAAVKSSQRPLPFFYFQKLLARLLNCQFSGSECGAGRGYLTVGPDGSIFACHREEGTRIGELKSDESDEPDQSGFVFDEGARRPWLNNCIEQFAECDSCWARYLCGGGCRQNRITIGGCATAAMPELCEARRAMMKQVFWIAAQLTPEEARRAAGIEGIRPGREFRWQKK